MPTLAKPAGVATPERFFGNAGPASGIYPHMRVTGVSGKRGSGLVGWLRIGLCLLALCWPLLATAAPVLISPAPAHACCRRNGEHHCGMPASSSTAVSPVCKYSGRQPKFAASNAFRPVTPVGLGQSLTAEEFLPGPRIFVTRTDSFVLSSRAPPRA